MTDREKAVFMAYSGIVTLTGDKLGVYYDYVSELMGRPIYTHEMPMLADEIRRAAKKDFISICREDGGTIINPFVEVCLNGPTYPAGTMFTRSIVAQVCDMRKKAIIDAIVRAAREEGIDELYLIDKAFVIAAIKEKIMRDGGAEE